LSTVYDTGVLIAAERNDRKVWADHRVRLELGMVPITTAPVVAQASRSPRQAPLHRFLRGCDIAAFTADQSRSVGALLAKATTSDVVDAHVAMTAARTRSIVLTGDPDDFQALAVHLRPRIAVRPLSP
jgi:predicted nucleic acid-binding protein